MLLLRTDDEYYTPKHAWEDIRHVIPTDKVLWEAFKGDGTSGEYLKELGYNVVMTDEDFFTCEPKGDIVVSNPPFSKCKEVLERLVSLDMPFILILPAFKLHTRYVKQLFGSTLKDLKLFVPPRRINFIKPGLAKSKCSFDCFYWSWKNPCVASLPSLNFVPPVTP